LSVKATIEGVVRAPSAFSMTFAALPSITETQEFVVPRSMPITLLMSVLSFTAGSRGPSGHRVTPLEVLMGASPYSNAGLYKSLPRGIQRPAGDFHRRSGAVGVPLVER